jgi:hypothetical protein
VSGQEGKEGRPAGSDPSQSPSPGLGKVCWVDSSWVGVARLFMWVSACSSVHVCPFFVCVCVCVCDHDVLHADGSSLKCILLTHNDYVGSNPTFIRYLSVQGKYGIYTVFLAGNLPCMHLPLFS